MGFGDFADICLKTPIPLCALVGPYDGSEGRGIEPTCYARSIDVANTIIFQAANDFIHILSLVMTLIMVLHVRSKFTAVGRSQREDGREFENMVLMRHVYRPERDYNFLLPIHGAYLPLAVPGLGRDPHRYNCLCVFRRCTVRSRLSNLHRPTYQRIYWISSI